MIKREFKNVSQFIISGWALSLFWITPGLKTATTQTQTQQAVYTEITKHSEFDACLNQNKYILIKFYAPGRGGCDEIEPAFKEVAQRYADQTIAIAINTDNEALYTRFKNTVNRGIPTIVLLNSKGKELTKQIGSSDATTLDQLIAAQINPPRKKAQKKREASQRMETQMDGVAEITTFDNYKQTIRNNKNVVLLLHAQWCSPCNMFKPTFKTFSKEHPELYCCMLSVDTLTYDTGLKDELAPYAQDGIPTTLFIQDGIVLKTITGSHPQKSLEDAASATIAPSRKQSSTKENTQASTKQKQSNEQHSSSGRKGRRGRRARKQA